MGLTSLAKKAHIQPPNRTWQRALFGVIAVGLLWSGQSSHAGEVVSLRSLNAVTALTPVQAASSRPVSVDVTVYFCDAHRRYMFVGDGTDFMFVDCLDSNDFALGDRLHLKAITQTGHTSNTLSAVSAERISMGSVAAPAFVDMENIDFPAVDCAWTVLEGDVLQVSLGTHRIIGRCHAGTTDFAVSLSPKKVESAERLVGCRIRTTGSLRVETNGEGRRGGIMHLVPQGYLQVLKDPDGPATVVDSRICCRGDVIKYHMVSSQLRGIARNKDHQFLFHVDGDRSQLNSLNVGTASQVEVTGTAALDETNDQITLLVPSTDDVHVDSRTAQLHQRQVVFALVALVMLLTGCFVWGKTLQKKVAEKTRSLANSNAQLRAAFDAVSDALLIVSKQGQVIVFNREFERMFRGTSGELDLRHDCESLIREHFDLRFASKWRELLADSGKIAQTSARLNGIREIDVYSAPVSSHAGEFFGRLWAFHDVTDQNLLQQQLVHSQKQEALGRLAAGIAHEFNNVLNGIYGALTIVKSKSNTNQPIGSHVDNSIIAIQRAQKLVKQLVGFARKSPIRNEAIDVNCVISEVVSLLRAGSDESQQITIELVDSVPLVEGDESQLQQVVLNLCMNALEASPNNEPVLVKSSVGNGSEGRGSVAISVCDEGVGIPEQDIDRIFEPFFTTKRKHDGTGLGLAVCDAIVRQHNGHLTVRRRTCGGMAFTVMLPVLATSESTGKALNADSRPA